MVVLKKSELLFFCCYSYSNMLHLEKEPVCLCSKIFKDNVKT